MMGKRRHDARQMLKVDLVPKIGFGKRGIPWLFVIDRVTVFGNRLSLNSEQNQDVYYFFYVNSYLPSVIFDCYRLTFLENIQISFMGLAQ